MLNKKNNPKSKQSQPPPPVAGYNLFSDNKEPSIINIKTTPKSSPKSHKSESPPPPPPSSSPPPPPPPATTTTESITTSNPKFSARENKKSSKSKSNPIIINPSVSNILPNENEIICKIMEEPKYIPPKLSSTVPESIKQASSSSSNNNNNRRCWNINRIDNEFVKNLDLLLNGNENSIKIVSGLYKQFVQGNIDVKSFLKRIKKHVKNCEFLKLIEYIIKIIPNEELSNDLSIEICEYNENVNDLENDNIEKEDDDKEEEDIIIINKSKTNCIIYIYKYYSL